MAVMDSVDGEIEEYHKADLQAASEPKVLAIREGGSVCRSYIILHIACYNTNSPILL